MAAVAFNYTAWAQRYPEFVAKATPAQLVTEPLATLYFQEACQYCDNTDSSPVPNDPPVYQRATFLNMLTAHIAFLNRAGSSDLVGRISDATEGSVSVSTDVGDLPGSAAWFAQSKYGFAFWQASAIYRKMLYVPPPPLETTVPGFGPYGPFNFWGRA